MPAIRESTVEKAICEYALKTKWLVYKFSSPAHRGVPDRMFISPVGMVCFLEIKAPGKKPTPLQMREIEKLRDRDIVAHWVDSVAAGKSFLDSHIT